MFPVYKNNKKIDYESAFQKDEKLFWDTLFGRKVVDRENKEMEFANMVCVSIFNPEYYKKYYSLVMEIVLKNDDNMENFCKTILIGMDPADAYYNVVPKNDSTKAEKLYNELKDYIRCMQEKNLQ